MGNIIKHKPENLLTKIGKLLQKQGEANDLILFEALSDTTIEIAVSRQSRSFNQLLKVDGVNENDIVKVISGLITRVVNMSYSLPAPVTQFHAVIMAIRLMLREEMGFEDAVMIIQKGLFGEFGRIYNKFDLDTWDGWINKYLDQRTDELERQHQEKKMSVGSPVRDSRVVMISDKLVVSPGKAPDEKYFKTKTLNQ